MTKEEERNNNNDHRKNGYYDGAIASEGPFCPFHLFSEKRESPDRAGTISRHLNAIHTQRRPRDLLISGIKIIFKKFIIITDMKRNLLDTRAPILEHFFNYSSAICLLFILKMFK